MSFQIAYRLPLVDLRAWFGMSVEAVWQFVPHDSDRKQWVGALGVIHPKPASGERLARCGLAEGVFRFLPDHLKIVGDDLGGNSAILLTPIAQTVVADEGFCVRLDITFEWDEPSACSLKALIDGVLRLEAVLVAGFPDQVSHGEADPERVFHPLLGDDLPSRFADVYGRETARHALGRTPGGFRGTYWDRFPGWQRLVKPGEPHLFVYCTDADCGPLQPLAGEKPLYRSDRGLDLHAVDLDCDGRRQLVWVFIVPVEARVDRQHVRSQIDRIVSFLTFLEGFLIIHRLAAANQFTLEDWFKSINLPTEVWDQVSIGSVDLELKYRKLTKSALLQYNLKELAKDLRTRFFSGLESRSVDDFSFLSDKRRLDHLGSESKYNVEKVLDYVFNPRLRQELHFPESSRVGGIILNNPNINIGGQQVVGSANVSFDNVIASVDSTVSAVQSSGAAEGIKANLVELAALVKELAAKAPAEADKVAADLKQLSDEATRDSPEPAVVSTFAGRVLKGFGTALDLALKAKPVINMVLVACGIPPLP